MEESIIRQKSRINWLAKRDANTKIFFTAVKVRQARNRIGMLKNCQGDCLTSTGAIQEEIISFYKKLLGDCATSLTGLDLNTIRAGPVLSLETRATLIKPVTTEEIDRALYQIDDNKTPGIDGFNGLFFKKSWHIIKHDVYRGVLESLIKLIFTNQLITLLLHWSLK